jgi:hypothetical protein
VTRADPLGRLRRAGRGPRTGEPVLDARLDGQRVVLVVNTYADTTAETVELFTGIAESATFTQG